MASILFGWTLQMAGDPGPNGPLKVFILAGQSNMVGKRSKIEELPESLRREQSDVLFFDGTNWIPLQPGNTEAKGFGPEITFGQQITKALGEPIGIIKLSVGGTDLAEDWSPGRANSLYEKLIRLVESARQTRRLQIAGMVWLQGGADAKQVLTATAYGENLRQFIRSARRDFDSPEMIFICGRSGPLKDKRPGIDLVRQGQMAIDLPGYVWIDCDDIPTLPDRIHFTTLGHVTMGHRLAAAMLSKLGQLDAGSLSPAHSSQSTPD